MEVETSPLRTSGEAQRDANAASARRWIVQNPSVINSLGQPVGYALIPGEISVPYVRPESKIRKRAGFLDHQLWVTPYAADEMYAAGDYPNQNQRTEGLARWARRDDPIEDQDVVVWYTMGVTHLPRPEEWPVMPTARAGFKLHAHRLLHAQPRPRRAAARLSRQRLRAGKRKVEPKKK